MKQTLGLLLIMIMTVGAVWAQPLVEMKTSLGNIRIELDAEQAPQTVENFLTYVDNDFYDGTIFHRVIDGFMIQGGGFTPDLVRKQTRPPIMNEADNGLRNTIGTIAMARTMDPHSATAQFFINVENNGFLDHTAKNAEGWGYCVFGKVIEGMDTVNAIRAVRTTMRAGHQDVPADDVVIEKAEVLEDA